MGYMRSADSETVALRKPVVPVADGFNGGFVRIDGSQLGEWHGHIAVVPANQHQHVVDTGVFRCQPANLDRFSLAERGDDLGRDASSREGKLDFVLQVVVPAESLFFGSVGSLQGVAERPLPCNYNVIQSVCALSRRRRDRGRGLFSFESLSELFESLGLPFHFDDQPSRRVQYSP
jgi:hypothetical protein